MTHPDPSPCVEHVFGNVLHREFPMHVADCVSERHASIIAALLNLPAWLDQRADRCPSRLGARLYRIIADDLRARLHED